MNSNKSRIGTILLLLAVVALLAIAVMMCGARFGLWEPVVGFGMVRTYMNPIGYAVTGLSILGFIYLVVCGKEGVLKAIIASFIGLGLLTPMILSFVNPPVHAPAIHDITTNTTNPPLFLVLDETRPGARNTLEYGGPDIAAQQKKTYPDVAPIQSKLAASDAFTEALRVGQAMGWEIVAQDKEALRFEATARTPVYQFADDVVVVVTAEGAASRVDIRSVSRIGRGDRGANAARIMDFIGRFAK
ncbi:DUF1499 domain-containing protein [Leucothrix arctica]|uniref:DUF1499 domain-containing protein n=1 Tax=Leucothrix arctica TaxID=1481894 RepID=A0A317C6N4_9GAMM|nr:DUF1499 domain-containing protein [Leucothrix arctica]PWQ93959.1 DUF1499 domain-containing protein [Leucothrix arctica]